MTQENDNLVTMIQNLQKTQSELTASMMEVRTIVGRMEGTATANHEAYIHRLDHINGTVSDHDETISNHESRISKGEGAVASLKLGLGVIAGFLTIGVTATGIVVTIYLK